MSAIQDTRTVARKFLEKDSRLLGALQNAHKTCREDPYGDVENDVQQIINKQIELGEKLEATKTRRSLTPQEVRNLHFANAMLAVYSFKGNQLNRRTDDMKTTAAFHQVCDFHGLERVGTEF